MTDRIHDAFQQIKAPEERKAATARFLREQRAVRRPRRVWQRPLAAACAALLLIICAAVGGRHLLQAPVSYVSIDVNPSVELALNRFDRVVSATAYNEDGLLALDGLSLEGLRCAEAIDLLLASDAMQPYLTPSSALTFTVAADSAQREAELLAEVNASSGCTRHGGQSYCAALSSVAEAHSHGLSLGKYAAYLVLAGYDDTVTVEDCHHMSMADIRTQIEAHEHGHHGSGSGAAPDPTAAGTDSGTGNGPGNGSGAGNGNGAGSGAGNGTGGGHHGHGHGR